MWSPSPRPLVLHTASHRQFSVADCNILTRHTFAPASFVFQEAQPIQDPDILLERTWLGEPGTYQSEPRSRETKSKRSNTIGRRGNWQRQHNFIIKAPDKGHSRGFKYPFSFECPHKPAGGSLETAWSSRTPGTSGGETITGAVGPIRMRMGVVFKL